ncbi:MAG: DUF1801 domain-containing protein [Proteobacteria bacterium]|nr:DUF1801 domain-containing protein [Pseudomonadota bacterium]MDA1058923.1 DUF1801 domain-containing protein [Pseudomonadota bacterium]
MRAFKNAAVRAAFDAYPPKARRTMMQLRELIYAAAETEEVGGVVETLKWGQPAYLPGNARTGTTIRLGDVREAPEACALFVHCQTNLIDTYRSLFGDDLTFQGNRAILFKPGATLPKRAVRHCVTLALTYHARKTRKRAAAG